jgi:hypothetical protein
MAYVLAAMVLFPVFFALSWIGMGQYPLSKAITNAHTIYDGDQDGSACYEVNAIFSGH